MNPALWIGVGAVAIAAMLGKGEEQELPLLDADVDTITGLSRTVYRLGEACVWSNGMSIDADGSPRAYGPNNTGLDKTANAGRPGNWWGVVTDDTGNPIIKFDGLYVSTTALTDKRYGRTEQRRYVDSESVNFLAIGKDVLSALGAGLGDVAFCVYNGAGAPALVADIAPKGHMGEGSIALAKALGIPSSPRNGGINAGVTYCLFPGSSAGWPSDYEWRASQYFNQWGGMDRLNRFQS